MDLQAKFNEAKDKVKTLTSRPSNEALLNLYGLFKQATEGDVHGDQPGMFDFKGAAKYKAWEALKGMKPEDAQKEYVVIVEGLVAEHG